MASVALPVEYGDYPDGVSELAYFASDGGWGDPENQHRFVAIKISDGQFHTQQGTYETLSQLLRDENIAEFEGVAIECRDCSGYTGGNELQVELVTGLHQAGIENYLIWPNEEWSAARRIFLDRTTGRVAGKITASENGEPLQWAYVSSTYLGGDADENGEYEVDLLDPGIVRLVASRRGRESVVAEVEVVAGKTVEHDFELALAKPACCKLEGDWDIVLTLTDDERPDDFKPDIVGDTARGRIVFSDKYTNPIGGRGSTHEDGVIDEFGEYDIDLTPFFGDNITASISNTIFGGSNDPDPLKQVAGSISHHDKVGISFIPRMSHGGITLFGTIADDAEIRGEWHKRDFAVMMWGTFVMTRLPEPRIDPDQ